MKSLRVVFVLVAAGVLAACHSSTTPNNNGQGSNGSAVGSAINLDSMAVGDVHFYTFAEAQHGLNIPASPTSAEYLLVVANAAGDTGSVPQYTVVGNRSAPAPVSRSNLVRQLFQPRYNVVGGELGQRVQARLRSYERTHLKIPATRRATISPMLRRDNVPVGTVPAVGSIYQFNVPGDSGDICANYTTVTAKIVAVSNTAIIAVDTTSPKNGFPTSTYDSVGNEMDTYIVPTETSYFGAPTDIDKNGHVFMLYTPAVNKMTPPGTAQTQGYVGGFTFAGDFFPPTLESLGGCPESNQGEIFYLMAPDPTGEYGNVFTTAQVREDTRSTTAHELQHAINAGNRYVNNALGFEEAWLDESLSSLAEGVVGRAELGLNDLQTLTLSDMQAMDTTMFYTFFAPNLVRTQIWAIQPDTVGAVVTDAREEQDLATFGAGWSFLRYLDDQYSGGSPRVLTRALDAGPDTGLANLTGATGQPLDTLLSHWLVTLYTDGQNISGLPAIFNYKSYNLRDIVSSLCPNASCTGPTYLPVTALGGGSQTITVGVPSTSAAYFTASGGSGTIKIVDSSGAAATDPNGRIYVVRLK